MKRQTLPIQKAILILILVSAVAIGSIFFVSREKQTNNDSREAQEQTTSATLEVKLTDSNKIYTIPIQEEESLFEYMKDLENTSDFKFEYEQFTFGVMVNSINGQQADPSKEFWKLVVNGKDSEVGISDYKPQIGDKIEFVIDQINF